MHYKLSGCFYLYKGIFHRGDINNRLINYKPVISESYDYLRIDLRRNADGDYVWGDGTPLDYIGWDDWWQYQSTDLNDGLDYTILLGRTSKFMPDAGYKTYRVLCERG